MSLFTFGIDLGTTFSCVATSRDGKSDAIPNEMGKRTSPSYVAFCDDKILVGEAAKNQTSSNIENTVYDAKRMIGHKFSEKGVQDDMKHWGFKVEEDKEGSCLINVRYKREKYQATPQEISSHVLGYLSKLVSEKYKVDDKTTKHAVITVPAYFDNAQRRATIQAGELAGMNVLQIVNEPTAAAIAYGYKYFADNRNRTILVYDFGGGTFDVSIIEIHDKKIQVKATGGDTHLGGEDINQILLNYYINKVEESGISIKNNAKKIYSLRKAVEEAKIQLSVMQSADVDCDLLEDNDIDSTLSRSLFNRLNENLFQKTITIVQNVLNDSGLSKTAIDDVVLIGGSSKIPRVQELLKIFFGKSANKDINPDEAVAMGAAILAEDILKGVREERGIDGKIILKDIKTGAILNPNDHSVEENEICEKGIITSKGRKVIVPNVSGSSGRKVLVPTSNGFKVPVKPSAGRKILIEDILTHSLGKSIVNDEFSVLLEKGTSIPASNTLDYCTSVDYQENIWMGFYEGEDPVASHNRILYEVSFDVKPKPQGEVVDLVTLSINENGVIDVKIDPKTPGDFEPRSLSFSLK